MYNSESQVYFKNILENVLTNLHAVIRSEEKLSVMHFHITYLPV